MKSDLLDALLQALRFTGPDNQRLARATDAEWRLVLDFCDRSQLSLVLAHTIPDLLPGWARQRVATNLDSNTKRLGNVRAAYSEVAAEFRARAVDHVLLKGFTQSPHYVADPRLRVQYDLDVFCETPSLAAARVALLSLGYEPLREFEPFPTDHLPVMVRKTGYEWSGDYFDPAIPISVDLHFRFWDETTEGFALPGLDGFWARRIGHRLHPADQLAYASLHLLRHVLRSNLRLYHAYELAYFLHHRRDDNEFWRTWHHLHPPGLRQAQAIAFRMVTEWFASGISGAAADEVARLPVSVQAWLREFGRSPVEALIRPNKNDLWLHLSLIDSTRRKLSVLRRRLLPARLPGPVDAVYVPQAQLTPRLRVRRAVRYWSFVAARAVHHTVAFAPTIAQGTRWWLRSHRMGGDFWRFLLAAQLFNLGVFLFFIYYNLHLTALGFGVGFVGFVASATTAGSIAGALPAGWLLRRAGLVRTLPSVFVITAALLALRSILTDRTGLIATAALSGAMLVVWQVSVPPTIAAVAAASRLTAAYSLFLSIGIGVGVIAGLTGGWMTRVLSTQQVVLAGCAITAAAALPLLGLAVQGAPPVESQIYPRSAFVGRYLTTLALWSAAAGAFNPFFNTFFASLGFGAEQIGHFYSASQAAQVVAILLAPAVLRRCGLIGGIAGMQIAAAASLALLACGPPGALAGAVYAGYMAFQYMNEPAVFTLLMNRVTPEQRSGASSMHFMVVYAAQAAVAAAAGSAIDRFGYAPVLWTASALAALAGLLLWLLLRQFTPASRESPESGSDNAAA
ncbi:MAG: MFS transporter [Bryobacteraceae bacterium]